MSSVTLVFPHQLSPHSAALKRDRPVVIVEEFLFFRQYNFHRQKIAFHRASMRQFADELKAKDFKVRYIEAHDETADVRKLLDALAHKGITEVHYTDPTDNWLSARINSHAAKNSLRLVRHESTLFLLDQNQLGEYFGNRKSYFQTDFYIQQRKRFGILMSKRNEPAGGKWTYDVDNRLRYPKGQTPPRVSSPAPSKYRKESETYVRKNFGDTYGELSDQIIYPTNSTEALDWLDEFLQHRFHDFGAYEDALVAEESILHHSVLTPVLNVGLITPDEVVERAVAHAGKKKVPLNSLEGFVRQIIGWREFIRGVYEYKGTEERTRNFWGFSRRLPASFWTGTTGIVPVDTTIRKVLATGYCHHIERLMVLGNFMLLCEIHPDDVYRWFMEMFIDSYDWVMVPNVYGMSQFADGGLMATKPYISGSNYLMKMGDYPKGDWQKTWDGLFWRFMDTHRSFFLKNPRLGMLVRTFDKMSAEQRRTHLHNAETFLATLH